MNYGVNFGAGPIPAELQARFAKRLDARKKAVPNSRSCKYILAGVTDSEEEKNIMLVVVDNGHRSIYVTNPRTINGKKWYGVYC